MRGGRAFAHLLVKSTPLISTFCIFQEFTKLTVPEVTQQNSPRPFCTSGKTAAAGFVQGVVEPGVTVITAVTVNPPL